MSPDTYETIKTEWCKISNVEQRNLIYQYIEGGGSGSKGSWMEFLQKRFKVKPSQAFSQDAANMPEKLRAY